jgi:ribosomal protein L37AE/L43A
MSARSSPIVHTLATGHERGAGSFDLMQANELTVKRTAHNYWVVQSGSNAVAGGVTRQAAEAERELMRRLRRRTADMRSVSPRRPRVVERAPR